MQFRRQKEISRFWELAQSRLAEEPLESTVEQVLEISDLAIETYRATITAFGRRKIRTWYTIPTGTTPTRGWPSIMLIPEYRDILMISQDVLACLKYATLTIFPRGQWESVEAQDREVRTTPVDSYDDASRRPQQERLAKAFS